MFVNLYNVKSYTTKKGKLLPALCTAEHAVSAHDSLDKVLAVVGAILLRENLCTTHCNYRSGARGLLLLLGAGAGSARGAGQREGLSA